MEAWLSFRANCHGQGEVGDAECAFLIPYADIGSFNCTNRWMKFLDERWATCSLLTLGLACEQFLRL